MSLNDQAPVTSANRLGVPQRAEALCTAGSDAPISPASSDWVTSTAAFPSRRRPGEP